MPDQFRSGPIFAILADASKTPWMPSAQRIPHFHMLVSSENQETKNGDASNPCGLTSKLPNSALVTRRG